MRRTSPKEVSPKEGPKEGSLAASFYTVYNKKTFRRRKRHGDLDRKSVV